MSSVPGFYHTTCRIIYCSVFKVTQERPMARTKTYVYSFTYKSQEIRNDMAHKTFSIIYYSIKTSVVCTVPYMQNLLLGLSLQSTLATFSGVPFLPHQTQVQSSLNGIRLSCLARTLLFTFYIQSCLPEHHFVRFNSHIEQPHVLHWLSPPTV